MPWIVGIDEAGYGPNLGPFVMSAVALHLPADRAEQCPWKVLRRAVQRSCSKANGKLAVNDSKAIYSTHGFGALERNTLPFALTNGHSSLTLESYWEQRCLTPFEELQAEPWFDAGRSMPLECRCEDLSAARDKLVTTCAAEGVEFGLLASVVLFPRQFNELVERHNSKAAAPAWGLGRLLQRLPHANGDGGHRVFVDKLGGRNHYHALVQESFPDAFVMSRVESARDSRYQVHRAGGGWEVSFQPAADRRFFPVALASMLSKYLREVMMEQFNRFWRQELPELKPTAGYPGDATRFYREIQPIRDKLGIAHEQLWRER